MNERTISDSPKNLELYGLIDPILTFKAHTADGGEIKLAFGLKEPTQTFHYAQLNDATVFLVNSTQFFELNRPLNVLRDAFLVADQQAPILQLEYARFLTQEEADAMDSPPEIGTESVRIVVKREDPAAPWWLMEPHHALADQLKVAPLIQELQFGRGRDYIDSPESLADYGLQPPIFEITLRTGPQDVAQTLLFGGVDTLSGKGGIFAKQAHRDAVFTVDAHLISLLPKTPSGLREAHLLTRPAEGLHAITYQHQQGEVYLENDPDMGWVIVVPEETLVNQIVVSLLVNRVLTAEIYAFEDNPDVLTLLAEPTVELTMLFEDPVGDVTSSLSSEAPREVQIRIYDPGEEEKILLVQQDLGAVGYIHKEPGDVLTAGINQFRAKTLLGVRQDHVSAIDFHFEGIHYRFEKVHSTWVVRLPEGKVLQYQYDIQSILDLFAPLNAVGDWEPDNGDLQRYGLKPFQGGEITWSSDLGSPVLALTLEIPNAENIDHPFPLGPLHVGNTTPDEPLQRYATAAGRNGIFRVKQDLIQTFREALQGVIDE
jgi:hypothetical protein